MQEWSFQCLPSFIKQETMLQYSVLTILYISFIIYYDQEILKWELNSKKLVEETVGPYLDYNCWHIIS